MPKLTLRFVQSLDSRPEKGKVIYFRDDEFLWDSDALAEQRDGSGSVVRKYFPLGQENAGVSYFYSMDHQASVIRELCDSSGALQAQQTFDSFGRVIQNSGLRDIRPPVCALFCTSTKRAKLGNLQSL